DRDAPAVEVGVAVPAVVTGEPEEEGVGALGGLDGEEEGAAADDLVAAGDGRGLAGALLGERRVGEVGLLAGDGDGSEDVGDGGAVDVVGVLGVAGGERRGEEDAEREGEAGGAEGMGVHRCAEWLEVRNGEGSHSVPPPGPARWRRRRKKRGGPSSSREGRRARGSRSRR